MALNPLHVEKRFRKVACVFSAVLVLIYVIIAVVQVWSLAGQVHVEVSRGPYEKLPNLWLCNWRDSTKKKNLNSQVEPHCSHIKKTGLFKKVADPPRQSVKMWPFETHGGPFDNGRCAFFEISKVDLNALKEATPMGELVVPHLFIELNAVVTGVEGSWSDFVVYAEAPERREGISGGNHIQASQSVIGWGGAGSGQAMPVLYTKVSKKITGMQYLSTQDKRAEYSGALLGTYTSAHSDDRCPNSKPAPTGKKVTVWLDFPTEAVEEALQQSSGASVFIYIAQVGGYLSIISVITGVVFVYKHRPYFRKTLVTYEDPDYDTPTEYDEESPLPTDRSESIRQFSARGSDRS